MKKLLQIVLVSSLSLLCFSCYYDEIPEKLVVDTPDIPDTQVILFGTEIQPIFSKCTSCHNTTIANPDLRAGNSYSALVPKYVTAGNADASKLYTNLPGNGHFDVPVSLSVNEIALIKAWINQGAKDN